MKVVCNGGLTDFQPLAWTLKIRKGNKTKTDISVMKYSKFQALL